MLYYIKSFLLLFFLFLLPNRGESQELQFIYEKTGKVTTFQIGDRVGYAMKNAFFQSGDNGTLTGFNENFILIDDKPFEIPQMKYIRHFKPGLTLFFGALAFASVIFSTIIGVKLLLGVTPANTGMLIFAMGVYLISVLTIELINGPKIKPDVHTIKILNEVVEGAVKINP